MSIGSLDEASLEAAKLVLSRESLKSFDYFFCNGGASTINKDINRYKTEMGFNPDKICILGNHVSKIDALLVLVEDLSPCFRF